MFSRFFHSFSLINVSRCSSLTLSLPPVGSCFCHQNSSLTSTPVPHSLIISPLFPRSFARFSNALLSLSFPAFVYFSWMRFQACLPVACFARWLITCWTLPWTPNKVNHRLPSTALPPSSAFHTTSLYAEPRQHSDICEMNVNWEFAHFLSNNTKSLIQLLEKAKQI